MAEIRDWHSMREMLARLLLERTGKDVPAWNTLIRARGFSDEKSLRAWLTGQGVTGYPQMLLVMETFGYPAFYLASAQELIDAQFADRPQLRPIFDALIAAALELGEVTIQARKTYVSLRTPRRTFARIQATTRQRLDFGLRLEHQQPGGRLQPSRIHESTPLQLSFTSLEEVDAEALDWLRQAYEQSR